MTTFSVVIMIIMKYYYDVMTIVAHIFDKGEIVDQDPTLHWARAARVRQNRTNKHQSALRSLGRRAADSKRTPDPTVPEPKECRQCPSTDNQYDPMLLEGSGGMHAA